MRRAPVNAPRMTKPASFLPVIACLALLLPRALPAAGSEGAQEIVPVVNAEYLPALLAILGKAEKDIEFIQLEFHYDPAVRKIQDAMREALKRGVRVRGLIEDRISFNVASARYLKEYGIYAKLDTAKKMTHNKLFIVDGTYVLLGSSNLSRNSMERNNETNVLIRDCAIGRFFSEYFEKLWADSEKEPGMEPFGVGAITAVTNRAYFEEVMRLFREAKVSIEILMYGMSYYPDSPESRTSRLVDALIAAARRGVAVRVLLDKSDYNETINEVNDRTKKHLEAAGVKVRWDDEHVTSHAKLICADGTVVIGSYNWGYDALERRNECAVIIRDGATTKFFLKYFDALWEGTRWPRPTPEGRHPG